VVITPALLQKWDSKRVVKAQPTKISERKFHSAQRVSGTTTNLKNRNDIMAPPAFVAQLFWENAIPNTIKALFRLV